MGVQGNDRPRQSGDVAALGALSTFGGGSAIGRDGGTPSTGRVVT
jgi:hypothetical protein